MLVAGGFNPRFAARVGVVAERRLKPSAPLDSAWPRRKRRSATNDPRIHRFRGGTPRLPACYRSEIARGDAAGE